MNGEQVDYRYDTLGRLTQAETTGEDWGLTFGYDGFGNLLSQTPTVSPICVAPVPDAGDLHRVVIGLHEEDAIIAAA